MIADYWACFFLGILGGLFLFGVGVLVWLVGGMRQ